MIWLASGLWLVAAFLAAALALLGFGSPNLRMFLGVPAGPAAFVIAGLLGLGYATAGILIVRRRPRHTVGWVLLLSPLIGATLLANALGRDLAGDGHPLAAWAAYFSELTFWPALLVGGPVLAFLFPDGRFPSRRWHLPVAVLVGGSLAAIGVTALTPGPLYTVPEISNPMGVAALPTWVKDVAVVFGFGFAWMVLIAGGAAVIVRFRRAAGDERQQLKWFTYAVVVWVALLVTATLLKSDELGILAMAASLVVPAAIVVAISHYRLYEIDTLINRTLVYLPLIGIVAGLYAAFVVLFQRIFLSATGDTSDAAAIISALILAAVFHPIRKLVEGVVDRRFKSAPSGQTAVDGSAQAVVALDDPRFEAAVERVVRRLMDPAVSNEPPPSPPDRTHRANSNARAAETDTGSR